LKAAGSVQLNASNASFKSSLSSAAGKAVRKQPYYFYLPSGEPFAFAGLYEIGEDTETPAEVGPYPVSKLVNQVGNNKMELHWADKEKK